MSLILDALRKSEAERRRGQAPGLHAPLAPVPPPRASAWRHAPVGAGGALVLLAVALLFLPRGAPRDEAQAVPSTASGPVENAAPAGGNDAPTPAYAQRAVRLPPTAEGMAPVADSTQASPRNAPREAALREPGASVGGPPARPGASAATGAAAVPTPAAGDRAPAPAVAAPPPPAPAADVPADPPMPTLAVLAPGERAALPPLKLSMHVWNETPAQRFAIVDGQRVTEGASVGVAVVAEIRRDGVVLDVNGRRVLLPRP